MDNAVVKTFYAALAANCQFEVVNDHLQENQLRVMGRIHPGGLEAWIKVTMRNLLAAERVAAWSLDLSKQYFLPESSPAVLFGWRIIVQSPTVLEHLPELIQVVSTSSRPAVSGQLMEVPLHASPTRHIGPNQKGARPVRGSA